MCRSIRTLYNFDPPATDEEIRAAATQFVRKLSGYRAPSKANQTAFNAAIDQTAEIAKQLFANLTTDAKARHREVEATKAYARPLKRFS